jgi:AcrR family transcriptional regulator
MDTTRFDEITSAAEQLFSAHGYHATSIRQVARAVDLQGGSLYAHIACKEDVLAAIVARAADDFQAALAPILIAGGPAEARLRAAVRAHINVVATNLPAATVYFQEWRHLSPARQAEVRRRRDAYEASWRQLIREGIADGSFGTVEPKTAARLCLSVCNWTYQWLDPAGPLQPDDVADTFSDLILIGLRGTPKRQGESPNDHSDPK